MFRSYEPGREGFVTLLANYYPFQEPGGGPNYFDLDPNARYRINIENDGDPGADLILEFRFIQRANRTISVPVGGTVLDIPLILAGPAVGGSERQLYSIRVLRDDGTSVWAINNRTSSTFFVKALDNIGDKTTPGYEAYAANRIGDVTIPGCSAGRVFVGPRKESFAVNLGEIFDLVNLNPVGDPQAAPSATEPYNITTLALELPISCLTEGNGDVIGGWTTAWLPRNRTLLANEDGPTLLQPAIESDNDYVQVSRLGSPLVNEVVIGLENKNLFNSSDPADDLQFASYVTNPTLPFLLEALFGVGAPTSFPRTDLLAAFVTGIAGVNDIGFGEMLRLNTAIAVTPKASQNFLGVIGGDNGGFPNGRRPGDDVVDIELRVAMGLLCHADLGYCDPADAPAGTLPYTDQVYQGPDQFGNAFPYLATPIAGSPNGVRIFTASLTGDGEVPPVDTNASGACTALINVEGDGLLVQCVFDADGVAAGHVHVGRPGALGAVVCNFAGGLNASDLTFLCDAGSISGITLDTFLQEARRGGLYVNIHTAANLGGEIRGQLQ
jgi:hypothetical protein